MKIRRAKSRVRTAISCVIALICVGGIIYSGMKIIEWKRDSDETSAQTDQVDEVADLNEVEDGDDTEVIENDEPTESMYWS